MNATLENGTEFTDVVELADGQSAADQPAICAHLALAMDASGSLVLRQQTPLHTMARDPNGQMRKIPQWRVYGARLQDGQFETISVEEMRRAHTTDAVTGKPLPPERGVVFGDLGQLLVSMSGPRH